MSDSKKDRRQSRAQPRPPRPKSGYEPESGLPRYLSDADHEGSGGPGLGAVGGGLVMLLTAYLIAESALADRPHPLHWGVAAAGAVVGTGAGWIVDSARHR